MNRIPIVQTSPAEVYSAPRKFDLSTILLVTTAFAILFADLRALEFPATAFVVVAGFFTAVTLGQAILFRGNRPRAASLLVGAAYFASLSVAFSLSFIATQSPFSTAFFSAWVGAFGAMFGYIAGVVVGTVFMVADMARRALYRRETR